MATTKLSLYNGALLECGERALASLTEDREPRRLLDAVWDAGAIDFVLGQGQWVFATRSIEMAATAGVTPGFGYSKAYEIPSDHLRTVALCADEYFTAPLLAYSTEQNYFFSDVEPIYLSYVSNDAAYGNDYTLWPAEFVEYVHAYLASKIIKKLNQSNDDFKTLFTLVKKRLLEAKSGSAMEKPTTFPPVGNWVRARVGGSRRSRGSRSSLLG